LQGAAEPRSRRSRGCIRGGVYGCIRVYTGVYGCDIDRVWQTAEHTATTPVVTTAPTPAHIAGRRPQVNPPSGLWMRTAWRHLCARKQPTGGFIDLAGADRGARAPSCCATCRVAAYGGTRPLLSAWEGAAAHVGPGRAQQGHGSG
jgi:hypothetical protein